MNCSTTSSAPRAIGRGILAVLVGVAANFVLSLGTDAILHATGVYRAWGEPMADHLWALALAYRAVYAVVGGYLAARLAPCRPMRHVAVLAGLGLILGAVGAAVTLGKGPEFGPAWYGLGIIATGVPCTWIGGLLHRRPAAR